MFQEWLNKYNEIINKGENMEENIKEAIERLNLAQNDIGYATLYSQEEQDKDIQTLIKGYRELEEYIFVAPNLDEITAVKYSHIQKDTYFRGRAEEQQKAEQIIYENYIPKSKIKEKIEELNNYDSEFCQRVINHSEHTLTEFVQNILQELMEEE